MDYKDKMKLSTTKSSFVSGLLDFGARWYEPAVGRVINVGSGREISIADLVHVIGGLLGRQVTIQTEEERLRPEQSEVQRLCASNALARELLGWEPRISLEEGLRLTIDWIRKHAGEYRTTSYVV